MVPPAAAAGWRSMLYPRPLATLPDILMIDMAAPVAAHRRSVKRFHAVMVETVEEQAALDAFLARERKSPARPDLLDRRPSTLATKHLTIAHYGPLAAGWPFVQLCQWPAGFAAKASGKGRRFARGAYTFDLFPDRDRLERASEALLRSLDRRHALDVQIVFPDWSADPGAAPG